MPSHGRDGAIVTLLSRGFRSYISTRPGSNDLELPRRLGAPHVNRQSGPPSTASSPTSSSTSSSTSSFSTRHLYLIHSRSPPTLLPSNTQSTPRELLLLHLGPAGQPSPGNGRVARKRARVASSGSISLARDNPPETLAHAK